MAGKVVTFRCEDDLIDAIDRLAQDMRMVTNSGAPQRSAVIRHVLRQATGQSAARSIIVEEANEVYARIEEAQGRVRDGVIEVMRRAIFDDGLEPAEVEAIPAGDRG